MKIFLSLLLTLGMATPALAQGKVNFINNSLHLVYWSSDPSHLLPGDAALAGQPYVFGAGSYTFRIELWAGTSSTALTLQATTDFSGQASPGTWVGRTLQMPSVGAGTDFFMIDIYDGPPGSYLTNGGHYFGTSGLFMAVASGTIAYNSLVNHNSPADSTWADGTYAMDFLSPGFRGAIVLQTIPEPSSFVLACLGFALLLIRGRSENKKE